MAKATIKTKEGTSITIEGSAKEVASVIDQYRADSAYTKNPKTHRSTKKTGSQIKEKPTITNLISSLIDGDFFKKPKDLAAVKQALAELGHIYPVTTLSPILLRLVRHRQLRRLKEKKRWMYTG